MTVIRIAKFFILIFIGLKMLKHELEFIKTSNESLAKNKIKNEIEQLLLKCC